MRLTLSSAAAPDATLAELLAACARRGLAGLELVEGHAHGVAVGIGADRVRAARAAAREAGVAVSALHRNGLEPAEVGAAARLAAELGAPIVVPAEAVDVELLSAAGALFAAAGAELLLAHGSEPGALEGARRALAARPDARALGLAWELRPDADDPRLMDAALGPSGSPPRYLRLHGGGPEAARQTGRGIGGLMARLALARYSGPLVLTPSSPRYHYVWRAWLGRAGGWGCGSRQSDPSLVTL